MRSFPIWIEVVSCIYNSVKSYGVKNTGTQKILVGTSKSNSHHFADITVTRKELSDGTVSFALIIDGKMIKQGILNGSSLEIITDQRKLLKAA